MAKSKSKLQEMVANATTNALEVAATELSTSNAKATKAKKTESSKEQPKEVKAKTKKEKVTDSVVKRQNTAIVEKVVSNREVKYIYPEDIIEDKDAKKRWRQQVRAELRKLERAMTRIQDQTSKEYKKAKKEFEDYQKQVLKPGQTA